MDQSLITAIDNYFKLKQKYEKQINDYISKIRKNEDLTKREKQLLFKQFKPKCINCKQPGGTLFTNKDRVLKAVCGSTEPCKLDIEINQGKYANVINLDENYSKNIDAIINFFTINVILFILFNRSNKFFRLICWNHHIQRWSF